MSGGTTAVRNEFDVESEETCPVENSSIVSEKGLDTYNPPDHPDENTKVVFSSQNAPPAVDMLNLQWSHLMTY